MKHIIFTIIILFASNLLAAQDYSKKDLIGKWIMTKQTDENGKEEEIISLTGKTTTPEDSEANKIFIFRTDGKCVIVIGNRDETFEEFGPYLFDLTGPTLKIGNMIYEVVELTDQTMILKEQETIYTIFTIIEHFEKMK